MSDDLRRKLQSLEADYFEQPLMGQQSDLQEINHIRTQLGMPTVDSRLKETASTTNQPVVQDVKPEPKVVDHTAARKLYQDYVKKVAELEVHRAYANNVADATSAPGQTPVRPLATMGTNGGPLLCDHCHKPMLLEGGACHGMTADVGWKKHPTDWVSWILGGMVVEIHTNGTLRIYHGYPGHAQQGCCNIASRENEAALDAFQSGPGYENRDALLAFLTDEFPDKTQDERMDMVNKILDTLFGYDPGIGINRP